MAAKRARARAGAPSGVGVEEAQTPSRLQRRRRILDAGLTLFLNDGFKGTSMDQVAARARVSKPTIYRHFQDKENLFAGILQSVSDQALHAADHLDLSAAPLRRALVDVATSAANTVLSRDVISLQRLVIGEFARFPDIARGFFANGPKRTILGIAKFLEHYRKRGELAFVDSTLAAHDLWSLTFGAAHRTKLIDPDWHLSKAEIERQIEDGVDKFITLYAPDAPRGAPADARARQVASSSSRPSETPAPPGRGTESPSKRKKD